MASSIAITTVFFIALIATFLYVAREVLIPIALAVLLSFVLSPVVRLLERWYLPRSLSVVAVVVDRIWRHICAWKLACFAGEPA